MTSTHYLLRPFDLIATLWDSTPDIRPPVALPAAEASSMTAGAPLPVPEQALVPHGLCGYVSSETGAAGNFVCQALGQVMPGVVFFVSLTVVTATLLFLMRYFMRSYALSAELEALAKEIENATPASSLEWAKKPASDEILRLITKAGKSTPPLHELAYRMNRALLPMSNSANEATKSEARVALRNSAGEIATEVRQTERWSGQSLAGALPGWLTAIGLLTTFIAILLGLQGVKVLTNLEVRGIGGLVNGLSGKFFSSIIALGCAISITITDYFISGMVGLRWTRLTDSIQDRLPHLSMERIFTEMLARTSAREKP